jgi:hypothetical protein
LEEAALISSLKMGAISFFETSITMSKWSPPPKSQKPSAKEVPSLWVQLPDVHTTRVLFAKDKLPDGFMFQPVTIALSLNIPRPSAKTTYP